MLIVIIIYIYLKIELINDNFFCDSEQNIYNYSKFKSGELLHEFHALSNNQTKGAA